MKTYFGVAEANEALTLFCSFEGFFYLCASKFTLLDDPSFIFMMNSRYQYGYRSIHIPIGRYSQHLGGPPPRSQIICFFSDVDPKSSSSQWPDLVQV